eukprot:CAMPEP_0198328532 /NCGR_PEP_ID=MMETSP1450-20131203/15542_1 /TAXON_ID=753684 ORGANISM="Madagascaria erythrocladiodes, Strain CCMP3234" /NCGR_SAMPLE_ID=MMETSP1450 /ASSEMBLY_ACC=CAM_ASM_001115 /LENGTH=475 /DNA_ID=CAMNT_0044032675 /DNA_START=196 /DNA_END=1623 /DNA_ORIENTATION=-
MAAPHSSVLDLVNDGGSGSGSASGPSSPRVSGPRGAPGSSGAGSGADDAPTLHDDDSDPMPIDRKNSFSDSARNHDTLRPLHTAAAAPMLDISVPAGPVRGAMPPLVPPAPLTSAPVPMAGVSEPESNDPTTAPPPGPPTALPPLAIATHHAPAFPFPAHQPTHMLSPATGKRLRTAVAPSAAPGIHVQSPAGCPPSSDDAPTDSVPRMVAELQTLLAYVASKTTLQDGSASFMRDYLRTLLYRTTPSSMSEMYSPTSARSATTFFEELPSEVTKRVFSFLGGRDLAMCRAVSKRTRELASDEALWRRLSTKRWRSLETDPAVWKLIDSGASQMDPQKWRKIYPTIVRSQQWRCRLQKTGRFICHLIAHQISGHPLGENGLPYTLIVERRFNIAHLATFVLPDASILYFEPETEKDRTGFEDFITYLTNRTRAGLALESERRYIFIPPCEFSRQMGYEGPSLLGVVQEAHVPLLS